MKITITLQDDKDGQVQVEEVRHLSPGEHAETVTAASALAEELLATLDDLGDAELVLEEKRNAAYESHEVSVVEG